MFTKEVISQIEAVAAKYDYDPAALGAIAWVESAGVPFWTVDGKNVPAIRFEGHYFDKRLVASQQAKARAAGLSNPKVGGVKNPNNWAARYDLLARARAINSNAALESTSVGVGQVMGAHWQWLGFPNVVALFDLATRDVGGQLELMVKFINKAGLTDVIRTKNWAAFARGYNGPGYKKNAYDKKLADAYKRLAGAFSGSPSGKSAPSNSPQLKLVQEQLNLLGYGPLMTDGIPGRKTFEAISKFQRDRGLVGDGSPGAMTQAEINEALAEKKAESAAKALPTVAAGGSVIAVVAKAAVEKVAANAEVVHNSPAFLGSPTFYGLIAVTVAIAVIGAVVYVLAHRMKDRTAAINSSL